MPAVDSDPLRDKLQAANTTLSAARARLAKIQAAKEKWYIDHSTAVQRVELLETELQQARETGTRSMATSYAGVSILEEDTAATAEIEQRLQTATAARDKLERLRRGLYEEESSAEREVQNADVDRHTARRAFLQQAPETAAVLAEYRAVTIRRTELANVLVHLDSLGALLDRNWYADYPLERGKPLEQWQKALAQLEDDPLTPLPTAG
jgi:chromosome segregation ATPase